MRGLARPTIRAAVMSPRGLDAARLLLRGVVGGSMVAHGIRHGRSLDGTARWFSAIGFRQPQLQARMSAAVEIGAGGALLTGTATPIAAAAVIGTMAVAGRAVHVKNGYFIVDEGYEYVLSLAAAAAATVALGPGAISVDSLLGADRFSGARAAAFAAGMGLAGAAAQLAAFWRPSHGQVGDSASGPGREQPDVSESASTLRG
jgi:putative oxidoreductase